MHEKGENMKRSEINAAIREAKAAFERHGWTVPPNPRWDVTDLGQGDFMNKGLVLVNLTEQPEYCEKLMYSRQNQVTPRHYHKSKKEDIICRWGKLAIQVFSDRDTVRLQVNGEERDIPTAKSLILKAGERITLVQGVPHTFWAKSEYVIIGEVSTANDDLHDNFFADEQISRFSKIEEDEPAIVRLISE
jgi:D-lyxose ketol-isomerase